jgi:hypothetical protein
VTLYNYELTPYPPAAPSEGKPGSDALFYASVRRPEFGRIAAAGRRLREAFGPDRVVYGVKEKGGRPFWEFYFYQHAGPGREPEAVRDALSGLVELEPADASVPSHFMWSFELAPGSESPVGALHLYSGTEKNKRRFGWSFEWDGRSAQPENEYSFYRTDEDRQPLDRALKRCVDDPSGLLDCGCVCLARKKRDGRLPELPNGLYLSGLPLAGFLPFLRRSKLPAEVSGPVLETAAGLSHLLFDVGFDFEGGRAGGEWSKSGFYGVL